MLYFLYGTDTHKSRAKLHELVALARKKRPDAELFTITTENWSESQLDELLVAQGLFEQKYTVVLDGLFEKKEYKAYVVDRLEALRDSEQVFLWLEAATDAASLKKITNAAKQVQEFSKLESKNGGKQHFNIFSITDGLVARDKRRLWISYIDLLSQGAGAEEIHGILFWQVKNMLLASKAKSPSETGLSSFVYSNASAGAKKYSVAELVGLSRRLVDITHRVRQGKGEIEVMLEKWVLEV